METSGKTFYRLRLTNVSCASCVKVIQACLDQLAGVEAANINFADRTVTIRGSVPPDRVIAAIRQAGYQAVLVNEADDGADTIEAQQSTVLLRKAMVSGVVGGIILMMGWWPDRPTPATWVGQISWLLVGLIAGVSLVYSASHIYRGAWQALCHRLSTMDTLITLGTLAAWIFSMIVVVYPKLDGSGQHHLYFEAALIVIALVNLGAALEMRARGRTSQAVKQLMGLQAKTARRINRLGQYEDVLIEQLQVGDCLQVRPGEKIPVDGEVIQGESTINESMLTGESFAVKKIAGSDVFAGTINGQESFVFKAVKVGRDTRLAQIIHLVKQAQNSQPPIAKLADRVAAYFVPLVLLIAILTAGIWLRYHATAGTVLMVSMSVLIIACPCALGLAAPIAVMIGVGRAAQYGVLIRHGVALQLASQLDLLVLDKTGTVTTGRPTVIDQLTCGTLHSEELLYYAAAVEQASEHPLGRAVVEAAIAAGVRYPACQAFVATVGQGVSAQVEGKRICLGNDRFMAVQAISIEPLKSKAAALAKLARTPIFLAIDGQLVGLISIADPIKPDVAQAVATLKHMGIRRVVMLSGDREVTARAVAEQVGIDEVIAPLLPEEKVREVKRLMESGVVGMIGDGVNDAPALAQANVGFAMGAGSDVAIESAGITLIGNSIQGVVQAVEISKATLRNIKQNLFGAFIYNIMAIPIAAGILYPLLGILLNPMIAGAAMAASSLTVVMNANRLRYFRIQGDK